MLLELSQFLHAPHHSEAPGRQTHHHPAMAVSIHGTCCPLPLYLITQPVLIDLGLGVAVVHGYLLAQDVERVLRGKAEHSEAWAAVPHAPFQHRRRE